MPAIASAILAFLLLIISNFSWALVIGAIKWFFWALFTLGPIVAILGAIAWFWAMLTRNPG